MAQRRQRVDLQIHGAVPRPPRRRSGGQIDDHLLPALPWTRKRLHGPAVRSFDRTLWRRGFERQRLSVRYDAREHELRIEVQRERLQHAATNVKIQIDGHFHAAQRKLAAGGLAGEDDRSRFCARLVSRGLTAASRRLVACRQRLFGAHGAPVSLCCAVARASCNRQPAWPPNSMLQERNPSSAGFTPSAIATTPRSTDGRTCGGSSIRSVLTGQGGRDTVKLALPAALIFPASDHSNFICPERSDNNCICPSPDVPSTAGAPSDVIQRRMVERQVARLERQQRGTGNRRGHVQRAASLQHRFSFPAAVVLGAGEPRGGICGQRGAVLWTVPNKRSNSAALIGRYFALPLGQSLVPSGT